MPAELDHYGYLQSQRAYIESQAYAIQYGDIQYPRLTPVSTDAMEWARTIVHYTTDGVGRAEILSNRGNDFPLVDISRGEYAVKVEMVGIGYDYTMEELGAAMMVPGTNLESEKVMHARRLYEEFIDDIVLNGKSEHGWDSFMKASNVTVVNAPDGAGSSPTWASKTGDEIIKDVNDILTGAWTDTRTVELADTICLSPSMYSHLANIPRSSYSDMSIMEWIMRYNVYTAQTSNPLRIIMLRGLETAGANAANPGRMVAYRFAPDVVRFHLPMPLRFLDPQRWLNRFIVPAIFRIGGLEIRRPGAFRYMDMIE